MSRNMTANPARVLVGRSVAIDEDAFMEAMGMAPKPTEKPTIFVTKPAIVDEPTLTQAVQAEKEAEGAAANNTPASKSDWKETAKKYWWIPALAGILIGGYLAYRKGYLKLA